MKQACVILKGDGLQAPAAIQQDDLGSGSIVTELRRLIDETDSNGETSAALIARQLVELAKGGDLRAIKECFDRLDGSPRQTAVTISEPFTFGKIVL